MSENNLSSSKRLTQIIGILRKYHISKGINPEKLKNILEDLGPTFVKIGQLMSSREDLFPKEYCVELMKLRNEVAPLSFDVMKKVMLEEYGTPLDEIFSYIDEVPLGSASIAQVYKAKLNSGEDVVVKIQRPFIYEMMKRDISLLRRASSILKLSNNALGSVVDLNTMLDEFWYTAKQEMDFTIEANSAIKFKETYRDIEYIDTPIIYKEYTTLKVLVMEYVDGCVIDDFISLDKNGYDRKEVGEKLAENYITQIIDDGFFHADPHPDNIRIRNGKIIWIDFGMMGTLNSYDQDLMRDALHALVLDDSKKFTDVILALGVCKERVDYPELLNDMDYFMKRYLAKELIEINLATLLEDILNITYKHKIMMPKGITMLARGMVTIESTLMLIDPSINVISIAVNHTKSLYKLNMKKEVKHIGKKLYEASNKTLDIPVQISDLMEMAKHGQFKINLDLIDSKEPIHKLDSMVNRITICILAAALMLASSLICNTNMEPKILGIPALGFIGFLVAIVMCIWLWFKMMKLRKKAKKDL